MDALKAFGFCALLAAPSQTQTPCEPVVQILSPAIDRWQTEIDAAAKRFGIPAEWIRAVMARESAGHALLHGAPIVSSAGAMGLMQLMPRTWSELRARYGFGNDPFAPHGNIFAGAAYLREMFDRYGYPALFAAYHAGPGRMDAYLSGRKPLPIASRTYLEGLVPGVEIAADAIANRGTTTLNPNSNSLFFVRANHENLSAANKNSPLEARKPVHSENSLFVPNCSAAEVLSLKPP